MAGDDSARYDAVRSRDAAEDGTVSEEQRPEADFNIEFQSKSKFAGEAAELAWVLAATRICDGLSGRGGRHMTNTDSDRLWTWWLRSA